MENLNFGFIKGQTEVDFLTFRKAKNVDIIENLFNIFQQLTKR